MCVDGTRLTVLFVFASLGQETDPNVCVNEVKVLAYKKIGVEKKKQSVWI